MTNCSSKDKKAVVIGAGPAGLAAGYQLALDKVPVIILEKDAQVGGLSRSVLYKGNYFDIGGHRFYTKNKAVSAWWSELLKNDFLRVPRSSKIFYAGRYFEYPLSIGNVFKGLGFLEACRILVSYLLSRMCAFRGERNLEEWTINRFGERLYRLFFKEYSQKVWGIPCDRISVDWAAQRIKGVSFSSALRNALVRGRGNTVKSLIKEFYFPRYGCGMMYEAAAQRVRDMGATLSCNCEVVKVSHDGKRIISVTCQDRLSKQVLEVFGSDFCSSMPLTCLVECMRPHAPKAVLEASRTLRYRSLVMVYLVVDASDCFQDTWLYVHSPQVKAARIQNFKKWSIAMLANPDTSSLGVEYFCDEGDSLWLENDEALVALARRDLKALGLSRPYEVKDSLVLRAPKAYPVYEKGYHAALNILKEYVRGFSNLQCMGRYGMFHYNGMDHSVYTGFLAAQGVQGAAQSTWATSMEAWDD
jgi:protoporphyrinogen oxidase